MHARGGGLGLLVDDGVHGDGGLAGLPVADEELALAAADGDERVHGLEAGEHGLGHGLARDDAGGLDLGAGTLAGVEAGPAVDGLADAVRDAAEELVADGDVDDGAGPLDGVPLEDVDVVAEDDHPDVVLLEVEGHAAEAAGEDDHLPGLDVGQAVDVGDAVAHGDDGAGLGVLDGRVLGPGRGGDLGLEVGRELEGLVGQAAAGAEGRSADRLGCGRAPTTCICFSRKMKASEQVSSRADPKRKRLRKVAAPASCLAASLDGAAHPRRRPRPSDPPRSGAAGSRSRGTRSAGRGTGPLLSRHRMTSSMRLISTCSLTASFRYAAKRKKPRALESVCSKPKRRHRQSVRLVGRRSRRALGQDAGLPRGQFLLVRERKPRWSPFSSWATSSHDLHFF